jgi:hypothetical protein
MLLSIALLTVLTIIISGITTIPFSVGLLVLSAVIFRKSWVFFLALGLGLFLDLIMMRILGYSSLILTILVFLVFLYERKFEIQTAAFVFISTFLGSLLYLKIFDFQQIFLQSLINALFTVIFFKLIWLRSVRHSEII